MFGGANLYEYAANNPVNFTDADGLVPVPDFRSGQWVVSTINGDPDFIHGQPHGHIKNAPGNARARGASVPKSSSVYNQRFVGHKVNLVTGEIVSARAGSAGAHMGWLPKPVMEAFVKQNPGLYIRQTEAGVFNYKKLFGTALGRGGGTTVMVGLMVLSVGRVANAEECDQAAVATQEALNWGVGLGLAAGIQKIPVVGPSINATLAGGAGGWSYGRALGQTTWAGDGFTADQAWQELFYQAFFRP